MQIEQRVTVEAAAEPQAIPEALELKGQLLSLARLLRASNPETDPETLRLAVLDIFTPSNLSTDNPALRSICQAFEQFRERVTLTENIRTFAWTIAASAFYQQPEMALAAVLGILQEFKRFGISGQKFFELSEDLSKTSGPNDPAGPVSIGLVPSLLAPSAGAKDHFGAKGAFELAKRHGIVWAAH